MSQWSPGMGCDPEDHDDIRREARAAALREAAEVARKSVFPQSDPEWQEAVAFIAARLDEMAGEP